MHGGGWLMLVGFGPGHLDHLTARAREAIRAAEVVVGYRTYIALVADLLEGKEVAATGMTEEIDRARMAVAQARGGRKVAVVSSGDAGIYGMAGLVFEVLEETGWQADRDFPVEVIPGVTALSAVASRVGAPLTHDFAAISLSDLLTPWDVIERRLHAAGQGDFVIALYNPQSRRRTWQLGRSREILLQYRRPETPVAVVKSAYREGQRQILTTLDRMCETEVGMLTTILIGNTTTRRFGEYLITPRGYTNKYVIRDGRATGDGIRKKGEEG